MSTADKGIKYSPHRLESTAINTLKETPRGDCCQATPEELCASTLKHYEEISTAACDWSNQVPQAIRFWYLEKPKLERELAAANERVAAQSAELTAIDDALGTNEGHSAVDHILALKKRLERLRELARAVTDWPPDLTTKIKALRAELEKE